MSDDKKRYGRTPDGRITECRAKDPEHCPYHTEHVMLTASEYQHEQEKYFENHVIPKANYIKKSKNVELAKQFHDEYPDFFDDDNVEKYQGVVENVSDVINDVVKTKASGKIEVPDDSVLGKGEYQLKKMRASAAVRRELARMDAVSVPALNNQKELMEKEPGVALAVITTSLENVDADLDALRSRMNLATENTKSNYTLPRMFYQSSGTTGDEVGMMVMDGEDYLSRESTEGLQERLKATGHDISEVRGLSNWSASKVYNSLKDSMKSQMENPRQRGLNAVIDKALEDTGMFDKVVSYFPDTSSVRQLSGEHGDAVVPRVAAHLDDKVSTTNSGTYRQMYCHLALEKEELEKRAVAMQDRIVSNSTDSDGEISFDANGLKFKSRTTVEFSVPIDGDKDMSLTDRKQARARFDEAMTNVLKEAGVDPDSCKRQGMVTREKIEAFNERHPEAAVDPFSVAGVRRSYYFKNGKPDNNPTRKYSKKIASRVKVHGDMGL